MKTRELILHHALRLFNERGSDATTVRDVAQAVGISHGNLCYHFPNTDALIAALYHQLVDELNAEVEAAAARPAEAFSPSVALASLSASFRMLYTYRFLLLDFVRIMRRIPALRAHYRELTRLRRSQFLGILAQLVEGGWMHPPIYPGQFEDWVEQATLIGDFWIASGEILYEGPEADKISHYARLFATTLVPMLTQRGQEDMNVGRRD
jgi:AcrR family transcriptional regulator